MLIICIIIVEIPDLPTLVKRFKGHLYNFLLVPAAQCFKIYNGTSSVIVVPTKIRDIVKSV